MKLRDIDKNMKSIVLNSLIQLGYKYLDLLSISDGLVTLRNMWIVLGSDVYNEKVTNSSIITSYLIDITKNLLTKIGYKREEGNYGNYILLYVVVSIHLKLLIFILRQIKILNNLIN